MSEGIFGKNADLAQRLKDRIAFHANEHRHTYEIGKGVMDALVLDLLADFRDAGGVILPVKPNGTVWLIRRRRVVRCDCFRPIPEPEEEEQKEGEPT